MVSFVGWLLLGGLLFVFARIYSRLLTVTTGAKTGHGVEDWVLGATLACYSFLFLLQFV